jgi:hypothetical protein
MKTGIIICALGAVVSTAVGLKLAWPVEAQRRYIGAHNEIEQIAFGKGGTDELRSAVTHERLVDEELYADRALGKLMIYASVGFSGAILLMCVLATKRARSPNQSTDPTLASVTHPAGQGARHP